VQSPSVVLRITHNALMYGGFVDQVNVSLTSYRYLHWERLVSGIVS